MKAFGHIAKNLDSVRRLRARVSLIVAWGAANRLGTMVVFLVAMKFVAQILQVPVEQGEFSMLGYGFPKHIFVIVVAAIVLLSYVLVSISDFFQTKDRVALQFRMHIYDLKNLFSDLKGDMRTGVAVKDINPEILAAHRAFNENFILGATAFGIAILSLLVLLAVDVLITLAFVFISLAFVVLAFALLYFRVTRDRILSISHACLAWIVVDAGKRAKANVLGDEIDANLIQEEAKTWVDKHSNLYVQKSAFILLSCLVGSLLGGSAVVAAYYDFSNINVINVIIYIFVLRLCLTNLQNGFVFLYRLHASSKNVVLKKKKGILRV